MFQDEVGDATKVVFPMPFVVDIDGSVLVSPTYCKNTTKTANMKRRYYLAAHRHLVNVLTRNSAFFIFAVLVV